MELVLCVPGEPISQPRCRATSFGGKARLFTPQKNGIAEYKAAIRLEAARLHKGPPIDEPVSVDCIFVFSRPKSHFGTGKKSGILKESSPYFHITKPDRDNCDKAVLDGLKDVLLADDKRVCSGLLQKRYAAINEQPHTTIIVRWNEKF